MQIQEINKSNYTNCSFKSIYPNCIIFLDFIVIKIPIFCDHFKISNNKCKFEILRENINEDREDTLQYWNRVRKGYGYVPSKKKNI